MYFYVYVMLFFLLGTSGVSVSFLFAYCFSVVQKCAVL